MARMSKYLAIFLVVILAVSYLLMVKPIKAQTIPKPSVPQFNLKYMDNIDNQSIKVIIHDQLPAKYAVGESIVYLYYNLQWKNHSENTWHIYSPNYYYIQDNLRDKLVLATNAIAINYAVSNNSIDRVPLPTIVTYVLGHSYNYRFMDNFSAGQRIDFQVKAFFGNYPEAASHYGGTYMFLGSESDWSPTQTITIPTSTNPSPTIPEFPITLSLIVVLVAVSILLVIGKRKLNH
jgi:hypothetical protein